MCWVKGIQFLKRGILTTDLLTSLARNHQEQDLARAAYKSLCDLNVSNPSRIKSDLLRFSLPSPSDAS